MVAAVRQGVPWSFTSIITSIRVGIPQDYDKWKERILVMYEERQRDKEYNDAHEIGQRDQRNDKKAGNFKQITAPGKSNTGGATSSPNTDKPRNSQGKWTTYGGPGKPMDVNAREEKKAKQCAEGHCFKCNEPGHLSRNCPTKKAEVRAVDTTPKEPLAESTKVEEVKE